MSKAKDKLHMFDIGSQWVHDKTKEPVWVMGMDVVGTANDSYDILYVIDRFNVRKSMVALDMLCDYTYIPPMKGAYK